MPDVGRQHVIDVRLEQPRDAVARVFGSEPGVRDGKVAQAPASSVDVVSAGMSLAVAGIVSVAAASASMLSRITRNPAAIPRTPPRAETNNPIEMSAPGATLSARTRPQTQESVSTTANSVARAPVARRICRSEIKTYAPPAANRPSAIAKARLPEMSAVPL